MASRLTGAQAPAREIRVCFAGERRALSASTVRCVVGSVLDGEKAGATLVTVTFLSSAKMRAFNRRVLGNDRATDVIGFALPHADLLAGDIYVCPATARRSAKRFNVSVREELIRLVVHGLLHVLGHDHPRGARRVGSPMWRLQERYIGALGTNPCWRARP